jgi:5,10-methylenetetrahydrofolate reductase
MGLKKAIRSDKFIVTSEAGPPKGTDITKMLDTAKPLIGKVDAINVTDLQSAVMRLGSLAGSYLLKQIGIDPIFQITCRDRNRLALQSDILSAACLGIENILALTGDHPLKGDHPQAKPVFDLDSVQLLEIIKALGQGKDSSGNKLKGIPEFCVGAVVNPCADPLEPELIKMEKKIASGVQFFQTQGVFDIIRFNEFITKVTQYNIPIIAGIILLKSGKMARYMNENVAGIYIPAKLIREVESASDKQKKSIEIAVRMINELKGLCRGVHIMPIGWEHLVPEIIDASGI